MEPLDPEVQGLLERVYAHLHSAGQWPELEALQRQIASEGRSQNVRAAVMNAADLAFISGQENTLGLTLRGLAAVPAARPLLEAYLVAVHEMIARYSDVGVEALFTRDDLTALELDGTLERELGLILPSDGWPFGSGSQAQDGTWSFTIMPAVLAARTADTVEALLDVRFGRPGAAEPTLEADRGPKPIPLDSQVGAEPTVSTDEPISSAEQDLLERNRLAEVLAAVATANSRGHGLVMGISGAWGSGKTSLLNLLAAEVEGAGSGYVVRFDPWLFSSSEELVLRFLREVSAQLHGERRLRSLAITIGEYAQILAPIGAMAAGPWVAQATASIGSILKRWKSRRVPVSAEAQRDIIRGELAKLDKRLVVLIDDLDRLQPGEVRDVVRLVKLVGEFPNTTYVLAYDEARVAYALGDGDEATGRRFLEKIVQISYEVPETAPETRSRLLTEAIRGAVGDLSRYKFDQQAYTDLFGGGITTLFGTVRDIRRYTNALPGVLALVGDEIELADVLAIEALRSRVPATFALIRTHKDALTATRTEGLPVLPADDARIAAQVRELVEAAEEYKEEVTAVVKRLFPTTARDFGGAGYSSEWLAAWRKNRRLAHPEVLAIYFAKTLPTGVLSALLVDEVFGKLEDRDALSRVLDGLDGAQFETLLERLEHYEADFPHEHPEIPIAVLSTYRDRLRGQKRHPLDPGADHKVGRVVLRLLRKLEPDQAVRVTRAALEEMTGLTERGELVRMVGYSEDAGHGLVSEDEALALEEELFEEILASAPRRLAAERDLAPLLWWVRGARPEDTDASVRRLVMDDGFMLALLRSSLVETVSQTIGDHAVRRSLRLNWEGLLELVTPGLLIQRLRELAANADRGSLDSRTLEALDQGIRHIEGRALEGS